MIKKSFEPISSFYIFVFLVCCILFALFIRLSLVNEIAFFQDIQTNSIIILVVVLTSILLPRNVKNKLGKSVIPLLKKIVAPKGNFELLEKQVYEQRKLRLEEDKKIRSNPLAYFTIMLMIIILVSFFIILNVTLYL